MQTECLALFVKKRKVLVLKCIFRSIAPNDPPYGIFLPSEGELFLFFVQSKLTADCTAQTDSKIGGYM